MAWLSAAGSPGTTAAQYQLIEQHKRQKSNSTTPDDPSSPRFRPEPLNLPHEQPDKKKKNGLMA